MKSTALLAVALLVCSCGSPSDPTPDADSSPSTDAQRVDSGAVVDGNTPDAAHEPDAAVDAPQDVAAVDAVDAPSDAAVDVPPADVGPSCDGGLTYCTSTATSGCVDTTSDRMNCGACGTRCTSDNSWVPAVCVAGVCRCDDGPGVIAVMCGGSTTACTALVSDANCGACGHACPPGTHCIEPTASSAWGCH